MTPERWSQIERIYHAALERDERERPLYLQETCQSDEELRKEVESLLARAERAEPFIESPALELAAKSLAAEPTDSLLGRRLGAYEILKPLGSGGMGVVYQGATAGWTVWRQSRPIHRVQHVLLPICPYAFSFHISACYWVSDPGDQPVRVSNA